MAEALEAAAAALRKRVVLLGDEPHRPRSEQSVVERARAIHPRLGPRQAEVLAILDRYGEEGASTGTLSTAMDYDQPNVYNTLDWLVKLGFVSKDPTSFPHVYRLTPLLKG